MVEISSTAISRSSTQQRSTSRPMWLWLVYFLFMLVCLNALLTYENRKRLVRLEIKNSEQNAGMELHYSAGAEEHVVSQNYGSSMYGGSIHTSRISSKKHWDKVKRPDILKNLLPKPSDGSTDYNVRVLPQIPSFDGFSFYVMTDTPFTDWQEKRLRAQMADLRDYTKENPQRNITFGLHLGDTMKVSNSLCAESAYERVAYLVSKGPRPTFVIPGNNDWYDCPRRSEAFSFFIKNFGPDFVSKWHTEHYENLDIHRSDHNSELFNFYAEGILFIGLHIIDAPENTESKTLRDERMKATMEWLASSVELNFSRRAIRGVIIMGHAGRSQLNDVVFAHMAKYFANISSRKGIPVIYLHGDGLSYEFDEQYDNLNWDNFFSIQIEQSGLADPVIIDVAPQTNGVIQALESDDCSQSFTSFGKGLYRLDRRSGKYDDPMSILNHKNPSN